MVTDSNIEQKIFSADELLKRVAFWRTLGDKIVFTNGCFDILHQGHIHLLYHSSRLGDRLIVGLNADVSVKQLKGDTRPINHEQSRAILLAAITVVDAVVLFTELTPENLITLIRPDTLVKGGDWAKEKIAGAAFVESYGGSVQNIPYLQGYSSTQIIERSRK